MKSGKDRRSVWVNVVFILLISPLLIALCVIALFWYVSTQIRYFLLSRKLYRFLVDSTPEKKTLFDIKEELSRPSEVIIRILRDLVANGCVEARIRGYCTFESLRASGVDITVVYDSLELAKDLELGKGRGKCPLIEFSWTGEPMRMKIPFVHRGRTLLERLRFGRS